MKRTAFTLLLSPISLMLFLTGCVPDNGVYLYHDGQYIKKELAADKGLYGTPPDELTDDESTALNCLNYYRSLAGVPEAVMTAELNAAAAAHAAYVASYGISGLDAHLEEEGREGFVGEHAWDRAEYFGFDKGHVAEDISFHHTTEDAAAALMATVYHRIAMLWPGGMAFGYGHAVSEDQVMEYYLETIYSDSEGIEEAIEKIRENHVHVFDFAQYDLTDVSDGFENERAVLYPRPGQANVPRCMYGEVPDPAPRAATPYGYPVTLQFYSLHRRIDFYDGRLYDYDGNEIECWVLTPETDPNNFLTRSMCILPKDPLPARSYFRAVFAVIIDGREINLETYFTTE